MSVAPTSDRGTSELTPPPGAPGAGRPRRAARTSAGARVVVGDRDDDHLVGAVVGGDLLEPGADRRRRADDQPPAGNARGHRPLVGEERERLLDRRHRDQPAPPQHRDRHARARREPLRPPRRCRRRSTETATATYGARGRRRDEALAVAARDLGPAGVDEVGERVRQTELGRPDRALRRGAEQPRLRALRPARQRARAARTDAPAGSRPRGRRAARRAARGSRRAPCWRRSRCSANVVSGSVPGARPSPRSMRPGYRPLSMLNVSATLSGL